MQLRPLGQPSTSETSFLSSLSCLLFTHRVQLSLSGLPLYPIFQLVYSVPRTSDASLYFSPLRARIGSDSQLHDSVAFSSSPALDIGTTPLATSPFPIGYQGLMWRITPLYAKEV